MAFLALGCGIFLPTPHLRKKAESMDGAQLSTVAFSRNLRAAGTNLDENIFLDGEMNHFFSGRKSTAAEAGGKTKMGKIDS